MQMGTKTLIMSLIELTIFASGCEEYTQSVEPISSKQHCCVKESVMNAIT